MPDCTLLLSHARQSYQHRPAGLQAVGALPTLLGVAARSLPKPIPYHSALRRSQEALAVGIQLDMVAHHHIDATAIIKPRQTQGAC